MVSTDRSRSGLNLLIYPSPLAGPGRVSKIARSLQDSGRFTATHVVGVDSTDLPTRQVIGDGAEIRRIRGAHMSQRLGALRILVAWQLRVFSAYRSADLGAVAAQNLFVLPLAHALARRTGAIFAYNAHELETETIASRGLRQRIQRVIERHYIRKTDVVSVVNEPIAQWYRDAYPGIRPVVVTNSPADNGGRVDLRSRLSIPEDALVYIHVGFLSEGRSIPLLLEVFARHPNAHLVFLGNGALRAAVDAAARSHRNIHRLDPVPPEDVVAHVRGADVSLCLIEPACLSMRLSTPNKLMESLKAGTPPLSTDLVEARRLLGEDADTWIIEDPAVELDRAIERITPEDVRRFRTRPPRIPTWDEQADRLVAAYATALDSPSPRRRKVY
ncbi:glycosyltransferase [Actinomyces culturomici]|uniref:glycosyltransferase n=1 Tax=Actinomyces culturomici TaxID=1926276 RepID=UPI000E20B004|nr:glycosyltransferase [Actinomyces culturomici]